MTMFTRNDKTADQDTSKVTPEAARAPATPERRPGTPQAAVQPLSSPSSHNAPSGQSGGVSVIGKAVKITGQIESTEDVQLDGQVEGDVRAVNVIVGKNAKVKGTVYGESVELAGTVDGRIEARKVVLNSTAHMSGDVVHADIRIDSGAYVSGHLKPEFGKSANAAPSNNASRPAVTAAAAASPPGDKADKA